MLAFDDVKLVSQIGMMVGWGWDVKRCRCQIMIQQNLAISLSKLGVWVLSIVGVGIGMAYFCQIEINTAYTNRSTAFFFQTNW